MIITLQTHQTSFYSMWLHITEQSCPNAHKFIMIYVKLFYFKVKWSEMSEVSEVKWSELQ